MQPWWERDSKKDNEVVYYLAAEQIYNSDLKLTFVVTTRIGKLRLENKAEMHLQPSSSYTCGLWKFVG